MSEQLELFPQEETQREPLVAKGTLKVNNPNNWYEFDWDNKIQSLDDIKVIFKSLRMTVSDKAEDFETLKKYIKDEVAYQTN